MTKLVSLFALLLVFNTAKAGKTIVVADVIKPSDNNPRTTFKKNVTIDQQLHVQQKATFDGVDVVGHVDIGGTLDVSGGQPGWHNLEGAKTIPHIGLTPANTLAITFIDVAGSTPPLKVGALVKLNCLVSGSVLGVNSIGYYEANLIVSPGATAGDPCRLTVLSQESILDRGTPVTIISGISGTGKNAVITLTAETLMNSQSVTIFYYVASNNLLNAQ